MYRDSDLNLGKRSQILSSPESDSDEGSPGIAN